MAQARPDPHVGQAPAQGRLLDDEKDGQIRTEVKDEVEAAVEDAMEQPFPTGGDELDGVYA